MKRTNERTERDRDRDRDTKRERQRHRETETHRHTERQRQRQKERWHKMPGSVFGGRPTNNVLAWHGVAKLATFFPPAIPKCQRCIVAYNNNIVLFLFSQRIANGWRCIVCRRCRLLLQCYIATSLLWSMPLEAQTRSHGAWAVKEMRPVSARTKGQVRQISSAGKDRGDRSKAFPQKGPEVDSVPYVLILLAQ